ncbi:MAG: DUF2339 domain-containing protein, partial [Ignavibacteria bacterium]|nr:DUF2339 domain-containing protein [Ignavibacteria bacterium]
VLKSILNSLQNIENRLSNVETKLQIEQEIVEDESQSAQKVSKPIADDDLEIRLGEYWIPKVAFVAFTIGMGFFLTFPLNGLPAGIPIVLGYLMTAVVLIASKVLKKSFAHFTGYAIGGSIIISYLTTLRLHFFGSEQFITSPGIEILLLVVVTVGSLVIAVRRNSVYLTALALLLGYVTAMINSNTYLLFISLIILSVLVVYLTLRYSWRGLLIYGIVFTYFAHLLWFLNNPFFGNVMQIVTSPQTNVLFILAYLFVFSLGCILRQDKDSEVFNVILSSFLNAAGGYGLFLIITLLSVTPSFGIFHFAAFLISITITIIFWIRISSRYSTFIYAMLAYTALSVAIIFTFSAPTFFIWLCWQSLLVVSTALWFRSKFIIVTNFIIFIGVMIAYLVSEGSIGVESLSFGIVALVSARILNWQKERLELETNKLRTAYLLTSLLIIPYSFYHIFPSELVGISWVGLAMVYYLLSSILKNNKYRLMSLGTLLMTVMYLLVFGITSSETMYKIISFLLVAGVLIVISLIYSKRKNKPVSEDNQ